VTRERDLTVALLIAFVLLFSVAQPAYAQFTATETKDVSVTAKADHTVNITANAKNDGPGKLASVAVGVSVVESTVTAGIGSSAVLDVGRNLTVQAETIDRNSTFARSIVDPAGAISVAIAVSVEHGDTK